MLVLTRYCDESVIIGDEVVVTVVDIRGNHVRLGITAPVKVAVDRSEVRDRIARQTDAGKPAAWGAGKRHKDEVTTLRNALHMVVAKGGVLTTEDLTRVRVALAGRSS